MGNTSLDTGRQARLGERLLSSRSCKAKRIDNIALKLAQTCEGNKS